MNNKCVEGVEVREREMKSQEYNDKFEKTRQYEYKQNKRLGHTCKKKVHVSMCVVLNESFKISRNKQTH